MAQKTIVICTSASFYEYANEIAEQLKKMGFRSILPTTAKKMKEQKNYDVSRVKTWMNDSEHFHLKRKLAMGHFGEVVKADAILIINDDKPGRPKYLGPNTMMEWGLAHYLKKPIFILNGVSKSHNAYEEVYGMSTAVLNGDLAKIKL